MCVQKLNNTDTLIGSSGPGYHLLFEGDTVCLEDFLVTSAARFVLTWLPPAHSQAL